MRLGGIGIPDLENFARAMRVKWLWYEWTTPNWPWVGMQTLCDEKDKALFAEAMTIQVGDGKKGIYFLGINLVNPYTPQDNCAQPILTLKEKKQDNRRALKDNKWVDDIRNNLNLELLTEYFAIWEKLLQANIYLKEGVDDTITWNWTAHGEYTRGRPTQRNSLE